MIEQICHEIDQHCGDELLTAAKIKALICGYHQHWKDAGWVCESKEEEFLLPIINPQTNYPTPAFRQAGKCDGIVSRDGNRYLLEHKTADREIDDPASVYWRQLAIDSQVSMYCLAQWQLGNRLDGTLYDVIRKPTISPRAIPRKSKQGFGDQAEIELCRTYYGIRIRDDKIDYAQESPSMYQRRLTFDIAERPDRYYQRKIVPRLDGDLLEWSQELWDVTAEIRTARTQGRHYKNSGACISYGRACEFLGLCSGTDDIKSDNWRGRESLHSELAGLGDVSENHILTHSRIKCFQACRRKHYYRYEEGIETVKDDEAEPLYFGRVMHLALESWWKQFMGGDYGKTNQLEGHVDEGTQTAV